MQDEHFQRLWSRGHTQFSQDLHQGLTEWRHGLAHAVRASRIIMLTCENALARKARMTTYAVFFGVLAGITAGTLALATTVPLQTSTSPELARTTPVPLHLGIGR